MCSTLKSIHSLPILSCAYGLRPWVRKLNPRGWAEPIPTIMVCLACPTIIDRVPRWIRVNSSLRCITQVREWLAYDCYNFNYASRAVKEVAITSRSGSKTMARIAWRIKLSYQNQRLKAGFEALVEDDPVVGLDSVSDKQIMVPSRYPRMS
jgi:hypothetical protein